MRAVFVGGLDRLKREYEKAAKPYGVQLKVFSGKESCLIDKIGKPDVAILLTGMISHNAKSEVINYSRNLGTPVFFVHTNGVSGLRRCLPAIAAGRGAEAGSFRS